MRTPVYCIRGRLWLLCPCLGQWLQGVVLLLEVLVCRSEGQLLPWLQLMKWQQGVVLLPLVQAHPTKS